MKFFIFLLAVLIAHPVNAAKKETGRILLLVDGSASMATSWPGHGGDRMGAVRATLDTMDAIFHDRDVQPEIAVRIFGDRVAPSSPGACGDTHLIRPWAPAGQFNLGATLDGTGPRGLGSLAGALEAALEDLGTPSGNDLVLIVTDGLNQCDADLETAVNSLTLEGKGAEVHIFGFALSITDQMRLAALASFHPAAWANQLIQGVALVISKHISIPLIEETVGLTLAGIDATGFDVGSLDVIGTWTKDPISVDLSRDQPRIKAGLGTATVIASEADPGFRQHLVRIPFVPEGKVHVEFFEPPEVEISAEIQASGWGRPGVIQASWSGAPEEELQLVLQENGIPGASWFHAETVVGTKGSATLELPVKPLELALQLRRPVGRGDGIIAAAVFDSPGRIITLEAPDETEAGGAVEIRWNGESYPGDIVTLVPADTPPEEIGSSVEAVEGSPGDFFVPFDQCTYEFRYIDGRSLEILARKGLEVNAAAAGLMESSTQDNPGEIAARWWGPAGSHDVIILARQDAEITNYLDWASPIEGSPARFKAPKSPGDYEIRYLVDGTTLAASLPVVIDPVEARVTIPEQVRVGERIKLSWSGPNNPDDFLILVRQGKTLGRHLDFVYVSVGSPTSLAAPDRPGTFEVRYVAAGQRKVLASATIEVVK